ncbi:hypothetical protein ACEWY4_009033 [Coilia grayii]|uniref:Uncharacterized protein n=1 Tax=Coilia grayii TaxID=363190 RepID=A0ABD1K5B6_9TELE
MLVKTSLLLCLFLLGLSLGVEKEREEEGKNRKGKEQKASVPIPNKARAGSASATARASARSGAERSSHKGQAKKAGSHTGSAAQERSKGQAKRVGNSTVAKTVGSKTVAKSQKKTTGPRSDAGCTAVGGICQRNTYVCQGRYLKEKCAGSPGRQCCMPAGAWDVLCAGHHHNRVRACDRFGCGAFNSASSGAVHKGVDIVCDDYGNINAPFTGTLAGPVGRRGPDGIQFDGVKLSNPAHCVKIFNIRPQRYMGAVSQGDTLGYLLPLQERFSGITSHLELQMCDLSDPTPFI